MLRLKDKEALVAIFSRKGSFGEELIALLEGATSYDTEDTGVGFYSKIRLEHPIIEMPIIRMLEYNFTSPEFPLGGSFMCTIVSEFELELEAVTLGEGEWPKVFSMETLQEIVD